MRFQGKITEWDDPRGFGFITPLEGGERVFVHISAFPSRSRRPTTGEFVGYDLGADDRGRRRALRVTYVVGRSTRRVRRRHTPVAQLIAGIVATTFLGCLALASARGALPWWMLGVYVAASIAAYLAYAKDKTAAQTAGWRTQEVTLLVLGLLGGWPGALIAQHYLHHKTQKLSFQLSYWFTVGLNLAGLLWLSSLMSNVV